MTDPSPAIRALIEDLRDAAERFGDLEAMLQANGYEANYARSSRQRLEQRIEKALAGLPVPEPAQEKDRAWVFSTTPTSSYAGRGSRKNAHTALRVHPARIARIRSAAY